jgi:signal transduction histidine kinase
MTEKLKNPERGETALLVHGLQAPLTILRTCLESALEKPWCIDDCETLVRTCVDEVRRLNQMVVDLLLLEKSEAGQLTGSPISFDLDQLIARVGSSFETLADSKGIRFSIATGDGLDVIADAGQIEQVLVNLVENAFKFTPSGGKVDIEAMRTGRSVMVRVVDTGIGIPPEQSSKIFERFHQVDKEKGREPGGIGLGLSIARALAEQNGGTIEVESTPGRGACFLLRLPAA